MPSVKFTTAASLNQEVKEELLAAITASVHSASQVPKQFIHIMIEEVGDENYAVGGETVAKIKKKSTE